MYNNELKPTKVLFFHIMKENFSGAQKNIYRLFINLNHKRVLPILVGQMESPLTSLVSKDGIEVIISSFPPDLEVYDRKLLTFNLLRLFRFFKGIFQYNKKIIKIIDRTNPDIIWCDNIRTFMTLYPACLLKKKKTIWNVWSEPEGSVAWILHRLGLAFADCINLEYLAQKEKIFGKFYKLFFFKKKIVPLYTGVSDFEKLMGINIRKELSLPKNAVIFIMASNITIGKGQFDLIKSMAMIVSEFPDTHLLIAGKAIESNLKSIEYYNYIYEYVLTNNLDEHVHFLGWRTDIRDIYQQSNVYVTTSYNESFPDAVREAMLASMPVLATDVGGTSDLISNGVNGFLFKAGDLNALITHMRTLLEQPSLRKSMGVKSKNIIDSRFSTKAYARNFENMIRDLL